MRALALGLALVVAGCARTVPESQLPGADDARFTPQNDGPSRLGEAPCLDAKSCEGSVRHRGRALRYYATHSPFVRDDDVTRVVIFVHGIGGSAASNFKTAVAAAARAQASGLDPAAETDTLILAPSFPSEDADDAPKDAHRWTRTGWAVGDNSVTRPRVSSFAILDGLVAELTRPDRFPNLRMVVVAGHSAGGQLAQRYAATSRIAEQIAPNVHLRFVVANPSSFLYLSPQRPYFTPGPPGFDLPYGGGAGSARFAGAPRCPDRYDRYRYGLRGLNAYAKAAGAETIVRRYPARDVVYLSGANDRADLDCGGSRRHDDLRCQRMEDQNNQDLDASCPAMLQGRDRHERVVGYLRFLDAFFPGHRHRLVEVAGAHHSSRAMFDSPEGVGVLFGEQKDR